MREQVLDRLVREMIDLLQHSDYSFEGEADDKVDTWLFEAMCSQTADTSANKKIEEVVTGSGASVNTHRTHR